MNDLIGCGFWIGDKATPPSSLEGRLMPRSRRSLRLLVPHLSGFWGSEFRAPCFQKRPSFWCGAVCSTAHPDRSALRQTSFYTFFLLILGGKHIIETLWSTSALQHPTVRMQSIFFRQIELYLTKLCVGSNPTHSNKKRPTIHFTGLWVPFSRGNGIRFLRLGSWAHLSA